MLEQLHQQIIWLIAAIQLTYTTGRSVGGKDSLELVETNGSRGVATAVRG